MPPQARKRVTLKPEVFESELWPNRGQIDIPEGVLDVPAGWYAIYRNGYCIGVIRPDDYLVHYTEVVP